MKLGLALSGGGVIGVAHLGLLKQIEKKGLKISLISGTSAGAIIGALFAAGGIKKVEEFISDLDKEGMFLKRNFILNSNPDRIFEKVRQSLIKNLPEQFYDLNIRFFCNATNYADGESVVFEKGKLVDIIMASSAIPGVFPAQEINGKSYIDGGMTKNLPAGILREKGADFIIGSSLYNIKKLDEYNLNGENPNRLQTARRAIDIMQKGLAEYEIANCDFCFTPPVETFSWYSFDKIEEIKTIGYNYAQENITELIKEIKKKDKKGFWAKLFND